MINQVSLKSNERRRKRLVVPIIYLLAEMMVYWLALSLIQLEFNVRNWAIWAMIIFILGMTYSLIKTVHIYKRQKVMRNRRYFSGDP